MMVEALGFRPRHPPEDFALRRLAVGHQHPNSTYISDVSGAEDTDSSVDGHAGGSRLLGRESVLAAIEGAVRAAQSGSSQALLVVGHAGMGKTRVHEAAIERGQAHELRVVRAAGAELEQNLAFGVAGQLVRSLLSEASSARRRSLLAEVPPRLLSLGQSPVTDRGEDGNDQLAVSHGVFSVLASAVERTPALLAIDDVHWADSASLELLLYLLHRLDELPVAMLMTRRPSAEEAPTDPLTHLAAHPKVQVHRLGPLGRAAIAELIERMLGPDVDLALAEACREATAGNPFFVQELLRALTEDPGLSSAQLIARARSLVPEAVSRSLRVRVGRLGAEASALARTVAVLGDDVPLRHAAALSGLSIAQASRAADALSGVDILLAREPLRFVHPLVRQAIEQDVPASERASRHLNAARLLYGEGEGVQRVAAHLLPGRAEGDPWVVDRLRAAARDARASAAPQSAVRYLERALAEPPDQRTRAVVLGELGAAEAALGLPSAREHLAAAIAGTADPHRRAELALELGRAYDGAGEHARAAETFAAGLHGLGADSGDADVRELRDQLQAGFIASATLVPVLRPTAADYAANWLAEVPSIPTTQGQRVLLAHVALEAVLSRQPAA